MEIVRNSPALIALTDRIEQYLKESRKIGRKPVFQEICIMLIDRLWDKCAQETKFQQFMDSSNTMTHRKKVWTIISLNGIQHYETLC